MEPPSTTATKACNSSSVVFINAPVFSLLISSQLSMDYNHLFLQD
jgi:hypothetical protein